MANKGTLRLTLHGVDSLPAEDRVSVTVLRGTDGTTLLRRTHRFPPPMDLRVPAFPTEHVLQCQITPQRYRHRSVGFFTLTDGELIERKPTVFRRPTHWTAEFTPWADLGTSFRRLRRVLADSESLRITGAARLAPFTDERYDDVPAAERPLVHAKATLLNLYAKLQAISEPVEGDRTWFDFVTEIVEISRERMIAIVEDDMLDRVKRIHADIGDFGDYRRTPVGDHAKNIPAGFRFRKKDMLSVKTQEDQGNLQLTLAPAVAPDGSAVVLLDTDLDENGRLLAHLADLFRHKFTGGTHPFDIHEFLVLENRERHLGYSLV